MDLSVRRAGLGGFALALAFALVSAGCLGGRSLVGEPVPAFQLTTHEGQVVNASSFAGRWLVLDLMATWCAPCRLEVAHLQAVQDLFGDRVVILSVTVDPDETLADMEDFAQSYGTRWPYGLDRDGVIKKAMRMDIIPKLIVVDPQGIVRLEQEGEVLPNAIARVIDPSTASSPGLPVLTGIAALGMGFLAVFNPYRRIHRESGARGPGLGGAAILAGAGILAWGFAGLISTRATYGALALGAASILAIPWWLLRARRKDAPAKSGGWQEVGDRAYEASPHFAAALVLGLTGSGALAYFAPVLGCAAGMALGTLQRDQVPQRWRDPIGLAGLGLVGAALVLFGVRIFIA